MNLQEARVNMLKKQIRAGNVLDEHILTIIAQTPREFYVPHAYQNMAYSEISIPIGHQQVMLLPHDEAACLQSLNLKSSDTVLEIGTGTGYFTHLLAKLTKHVYSLDIFEDFTQNATANLQSQKIKNISLLHADGALGWSEKEPYDVIVCSASMELLPKSLLRELKIGGRLFCVLGTVELQKALLIIRDGKNHWSDHLLFETSIPPLINAPKNEPFIF